MCSSFYFLLLIVGFLLSIQVLGLTVNTYEIRDLEDTTTYFETEAQRWQLTNGLQTYKSTSCGSAPQLLGGYQVLGVGGIFTRTYYSLPSHSALSFSMIFWLVDLAETTNIFQIYFDDQDLGVWDSYLYNYASGNYQTNYCGLTNLDFPNLNVQGKIPHYANQITLKIVSTTTSSAFSFGFRSISLLFSNSTVTTASSCKFVYPTTSQNTCGCPDGYYNPLGSTSCLTCDSACASCSGSTANDCTSCKPGYSFDGSKCFPCNAACSQCSGTAANQCVRCANSAYFLKFDGTCSSTCSSPYVANTKGIYKTCDYPCGATGFLNDNGTCSTACPYPYTQETVSGIQYCHATCGTTQFLFKDKTCKSNCPNSFIEGTDGYIKYCTTACDSTEYYNPNSSCTTGCPSPYVSSTSGGMKYCNPPCSGTSYLYQNSSCLAICPYPYMQSSDGFINYCNPPCGTGQFFNENNNCTGSCLSPYIQMNIYGVLYCQKPCSGTGFLYSNGSCGAFCVSPYTQGTDGYVKYCYSPCDTGQFLNENNNCTLSCLSPYVQSSSNGVQYCTKPCTGADFLYAENNTCGAFCVSPYTQGTDGYVKYCYSPCPGTAPFLNENNNCTGSCLSPYVQSSSNGVQYCLRPCGANFLYQNGTCGTACVSPYTQGTDGYVKYCYSPCGSGQFLNENSNCTGSCLSPYIQSSSNGVQYCTTPCGTNFLYQNNTCGATCVSPYTQGTDGYVKYCYSPCPSTAQFLNDYNSTCTASCPAPYVQSSSNGVQYCSRPCGSDFLYQNNTCGVSCSSPFTQIDDGFVKYCNSPCSSVEFLNDNSNCTSSCLDPYVQSSSNGVQYCKTPCGTANFFYENSTCGASCVSPYTQGTDGYVKYCYSPCSGTAPFLNENNNCTSSCPTPYVQSSSNGVQYCKTPCGTTDFLYQNNTCGTTCASPYTQTTDGFVKYCNPPCDSTEFYSRNNGSCLPSCSSPYLQLTIADITYCNSPCDSSKFIYSNGSCLSSCPSPFKQRSAGGFQYCDKPCADPLFLYSNGSCLSDCDYTDFTDANQINYCHPCSSSQYHYENGACKASCPSPYDPEIVDSYLKLCNSPCDSSLYYSENQQKCITSCPSQYSTKSLSSLKICQDNTTTTSESSSSGTLSGVASAITSISNVVSTAGSILRPNNRNSIFMVSLAKLVKYVIYIDISLPDKVKDAFKSSNSSLFSFSMMFSFNMPSSWANAFPTYPLPEVFANNGASSCYLLNQWTSLSSYLIIGMLGVMSGLLESVVKRSSKKRFAMVLTRIRIITQWAFVLFLLFNSFDDFTFYAILQIYSLQFHSDLDYLSFAVCLFMSFVAFGILIKTIFINHRAQKVQNQIIDSSKNTPSLAFYQKWKGFQVIYAGFKPKTFLMQVYLVTSTARIVISYLIVGFLYKFPVLQGCLLVLLSTSVLSFLLYKKPVKDPVNFFVMITYETLVFSVNICVLIIAILDSEDADGNSSQSQVHDLVCNILLILNGIISICGDAFMYVYLAWNAWGFYKINKKTPGFESKLVWINLFISPYQNPGMDFDDFSYKPSSYEKSSSATKIKIYPLRFEGKDQNYLEISGKNSSITSLQKLNRRFSNFSQNTAEPNDASGVTTNLEPNRRLSKFKGKSFGTDSQNTLDLDSDYHEFGFSSPLGPDTLSLDTPKSFAQSIMLPKYPIDGSPNRRQRDLRRPGRPGMLRKAQIPIVTSMPEPFVIVEEPSPALKRNPSETRRRRRTAANPQENFEPKENFLDYSEPVYARKHAGENSLSKVERFMDYSKPVYARKGVVEAAGKGFTKPLRLMNTDLMNIEDLLGSVSDSPPKADSGEEESQKTRDENLSMKNVMRNDNKNRRKESFKGLAMSYRETSGAAATSKRELKKSEEEDGGQREDWEKNLKEYVRTNKKTRSMIKVLFFPNEN